MEPQPVEIRGDTILLQALLKYVGEISNGGDVRGLLAEDTVRVNGEVEHRRGRQLRGGDVVAVEGGGAYRVVAGPA